jgi:hypothetical protein
MRALASPFNSNKGVLYMTNSIQEECDLIELKQYAKEAQAAMRKAFKGYPVPKCVEDY